MGPFKLLCSTSNIITIEKFFVPTAITTDHSTIVPNNSIEYKQIPDSLKEPVNEKKPTNS